MHDNIEKYIINISIKSTFKKMKKKTPPNPLWKNDALINYQNIMCIFDNEAAKPLFYNIDIYGYLHNVDQFARQG